MEAGNTAAVTTERQDHILSDREPIQLTRVENQQADLVFGDVLDAFVGEDDERELSDPSALLNRARIAIERRSPGLSPDRKELIARTAVTDLLAAVAKATREATTLTSDNAPDTTA